MAMDPQQTNHGFLVTYIIHLVSGEIDRKFDWNLKIDLLRSTALISSLAKNRLQIL
jgi:hypothetical protein